MDRVRPRTPSREPASNGNIDLIDESAIDAMDTPLLVAALRAHSDRLRHEMATVDSLLTRATTSPSHIADVVNTVSMMTVPRWHFAMLNDKERCDAYSVALERRIRPGMHVLDIGTGGGLLALMAARAGAEHVTTCESNPLIAELARRIISSAGMDDRVTVIARSSHELVVGRDLDRRVDLVVSEIVDCGLIGEGLLPTIRHARANLLAEGGLFMPQQCRIFGAVVSSPAVMALNQVGMASGFDMALFNVAATTRHFPINLWARPHQMLCEPTQLVCFDFATDSLDDGWADVELHIDTDGPGHGLVVWFEMDLGNGVSIRNSPDNHSSHWMQAFVPFAEVVPLKAETYATVRLAWHNTRLSAGITTDAGA